MQCSDLDLSKSGETSQLSEDLSEIKFSINRIIISNTHLLHKSQNIDQNTHRNPESQTIGLKLKFYSVLSGCKLKQKFTRASIINNTSSPYDAYVLTLPKDAINLKVSFPTNQEYEIMGKVYTYDNENSMDSNSDKRLIGTFQINLLEWTKGMRKQSGSSEQQNPESTTSLKLVELIIKKKTLGQAGTEQTMITDSSLVSGLEKAEPSEAIENGQITSLNQQFNPLQNFIECRILNGEFVESIFNNFNLDSIQDLIHKQKNLKIVKSIIDEKIEKTHRVPHLTTRSSQFYLLPERQVLRNINRTKSEALLKPVSHSNVQEITPRESAEILIKRQQKTFNEQIYELLQQVKQFKNSANIQRKSLERNSSISRIKNLYLMSPRRQQQSHLNAFYENPSLQRSITEFQELIPLSSIIKNSQSEINLSILQNELEPTIALNAKYKKVSRVQERLESFEKMRSLSSLNLFKIQQSQEVSDKQIKASN